MKNKIIEGISLENFRVFKDKSDFELAPITILTGANCSGKSSLIKAQKLLKTFWEKEVLDFTKDEYLHKLGDYNHIINNNKGGDNITITYEIDPIYILGSLVIEIIFSPCKKFNNGEMKSFSVYRKKNKKLIQLFSVSNKEHGFINRKYFIQTLFSEINENNKRLEEYNTKAKKYSYRGIDNNKGEINGFGGNIISDYIPYNSTDEGDMLYLFHSEATEDFCNHINVEKLKFDEYSKHFDLFDENFDFSNEIDIDVRNLGITDLEKYKYLPDFVKLIVQISKEKYDDLESALWYLLTEEYPEIESHYKYTKQSFIDKSNSFISAFEEGIIKPSIESLSDLKHYLKEHVKTDLMSFLKEIDCKTLPQLQIGNISSSIRNLFISRDSDEILCKKDRDFLVYLQYLFVVLFKDKIWDDKSTEKIHKEMGIKIYDDLFPKLGEIFIKIIDKCIKSTYSKTYFIEGVRAEAKRDYSSSDRFYNFLLDYIEKEEKYYPPEMKFRKDWIKKFEIGDDILLKYNLGKAELWIKRGENEINTVDMGYGVTQFIPILMHIIYENKIKKKYYNNRSLMDVEEENPIFYIEEPESNLHPKLQSELADLFLDAYRKFGVRFVIETHSEYLIRKLQYLTAKGEIKPEESIIHYISHPDAAKREDGEEQVRAIHIKSNGQLTKPFGSGFFDEADNLALLLLDYPLN